MRSRAARRATTWTTTSSATKARSRRTPTRTISTGAECPGDIPQLAAGGIRHRSRPSTGSGNHPSRCGTTCSRSRPSRPRSSGNYAPWADHRTFMEASFARRLQAGARRGRRGGSGRPHRRFGHAGHDRLQRLRLVPARPGHRRFPFLRRRQPVGPAPVLRQTGRDDRLLDRLRVRAASRCRTPSGPPRSTTFCTRISSGCCPT